MRSLTKKRSGAKPETMADKKLSIAHLNDSIKYNKRHIADHQRVEKQGGSKKYNEKHIKGHKKQIEKDKKLLEKRKKMEIKKRTAKRLGPAKAKTMLKDNSAQGHPLTSKQKKLFQAVAHGFKPTKQRKLPQAPHPPAVPYFTSSNTFMNEPGGKQQNPNPGLINPEKKRRSHQRVTGMKASLRRLQRGMRGYRK